MASSIQPRSSPSSTIARNLTARLGKARWGRKASDGDENALARAFGVSANALAGEIEFKRARAALNSRGGHDGRCTDGRRRGRRREEEGG